MPIGSIGNCESLPEAPFNQIHPPTAFVPPVRSPGGCFCFVRPCGGNGTLPKIPWLSLQFSGSDTSGEPDYLRSGTPRRQGGDSRAGLDRWSWILINSTQLNTPRTPVSSPPSLQPSVRQGNSITLLRWGSLRRVGSDWIAGYQSTPFDTPGTLAGFPPFDSQSVNSITSPPPALHFSSLYSLLPATLWQHSGAFK